MKKRIVLSCLLVALALVILFAIRPVLSVFHPEAKAPNPDLASLLNYPYPVQIEELQARRGTWWWRP